MLVVLVIAWAPWLTDSYVVGRVVGRLGGPEVNFSYLGQSMALKDVPKEVHWLPFGRYVTFPSEAGWFVTFWGEVI